MVQESCEKLVTEYLERKGKNARYSERAFAKSAGLSAGFLKLLFQGKRALSPEKAREVANRLGWSELEATEFLATVQREKLTRKGKPQPPHQTIECFAEISDWYHFAIVEILKTKRRISVEEIVRRLGISSTEAQFSLRALARAGLIRLDQGSPVAIENYVVPAMSTSAIRKFHSQMLTKARDAIEGQPVSKRELRSLTLAID
ncbi:MAG: TIGR02147 family protein, partial [Bdellovibrionota bacterium]